MFQLRSTDQLVSTRDTDSKRRIKMPVICKPALNNRRRSFSLSCNLHSNEGHTKRFHYFVSQKRRKKEKKEINLRLQR